MSIKIMSEVWENAPLVGTDLLVLLALADMANDENRECWPGLKNLSHKARISTRQVSNVLGDLELQGIICITSRLTEKGGNTSNLYRISEVSNWAVLQSYMDDNAPMNHSSSPIEPQFTPPISVAPVEVHTNRLSDSSLKGKSRKRSTPAISIHPLIQVWATVRGIDSVNIGAPIYSAKDTALAKRMAKWDVPPTDKEIEAAVKASKVDKYPFMWLEQDIPKARLANTPKPVPPKDPNKPMTETEYDLLLIKERQDKEAALYGWS